MASATANGKRRKPDGLKGGKIWKKPGTGFTSLKKNLPAMNNFDSGWGVGESGQFYSKK